MSATMSQPGTLGHLELLLNTAPLAVVASDRHGRIVLANARAESLFGYPHGTLIGKTVELLVPEARRDNHRALREEFWEQPQPRAMDGTLEFRARRSDGSEFPVEIGLTIAQTEDGPVALTYLADLTARREAETGRTMQVLLESAPVAIVVTDRAGQIVLANARSEEVFGYGRAELLGQPIELLLPGEYRVRHRHLREGFSDAAGDSPHVRPMGIGLDLVARHRDGRYFPVEIGLSNIETPQGVRVLSFIIDISGRKRAENTLMHQKRLFESLAAVARATAAGPALETTLQNALEVASELTGADYGSIILLDDQAGASVSVLGRGKLVQRNRSIEDLMRSGLAGWVAREHRPALIADTHQDERWIKLPDEPYQTRAVLAVPIVSDGVVRGILTLQHRDTGHFTAEHLELMQAAADQMALAVKNAQSYEAQRRAAERRRAMYDVLRALSGWFGADALARAAVQAIAQYTGHRHVAVVLPDENRPDGWRVVAATGGLAPVTGSAQPLHGGVIGRCLRSQQTQYVPDAANDPDYLAVHPALRSELAVPLLRGERVVGVLNLESERVDGFDREDMALAESLAEAVALGLDNARLYQAVLDERSRLQALIDSSRDGVLLAGVDGTIAVVNNPTLVLLGLPGEREDWLGRRFEYAVTTLREVSPEVAAALANAMVQPAAGQPIAEGAYELDHLSVRWLCLPVSAQTQAVGHLLVLRDVTQEAQLERLRDDLTHTMVHDLRNPLTAIQSSMELVHSQAAGPLTREQDAIIDIARLSAQQMIQLVTAILDVNRLELGRMPVDHQAVDLATLAGEVSRLQAPLARERDLALAGAVPTDLPRVWVDPGLIGRVFQNLIGNAIKFSPDGKTVTIGAVLDGGYVRATVSDQGDGIPENLLGQLFQKFATGTQRGRGTGLGLAYCRLAVEAHGGRIWVESSPGQGATFCFTLPVAG